MKFIHKNAHIIIPALVVLVAVFLIIRGVQKSKQPGTYDAFAQCLTDNGVTYYGAFWCPNCQAQGEMFGKSKKFINYVECSTPQRGQKTVCREAGITSYPTWDIGSVRLEGVQSFETLAMISGCALPGQESVQEADETLSETNGQESEL
ncbi:MAG: hypothetical protein LRY41_02765 [Candidatus Pacebacteria bacterium]|nr:hypothetical protein [Candidatus Paceibacterota bacterium]MCD8508085.1 hypothetical protein [Candidatus Paceibacterota bacterium]MCD8528220.1 hypothetical protein [Candidatus Paceibacterota bacterium]MCD8563858.1 hypothetical protein [Candidatus Paceibacterota bacterium]